MIYSDDPAKDFERHDAEQERLLARLPICYRCDEPIQQEDAVRLNGVYYCDACLKDMRVSIDID